MDDQGAFKLIIELDSCMPVLLNDGKEITRMYICPGDSLFLSLDTKSFDESIFYQGAGAERNNILSEYFLRFLDENREGYIDLRFVKDTSMASFYNLVNDLGEGMSAYVKELKQEKNLEGSFIRFMETDAYFTRINLLSSPWSFMSRTTDTSEIADSLRNVIRQIVIDAAIYDDPDWLNEEFYRYYMHSLEWCFLFDIIKENKKLPWKYRDSLFYAQYQSVVHPEMFQKFLMTRAKVYKDAVEPYYLEKTIFALDNYVTDQDFKEEYIQKCKERLEKVNQPLNENAVLIDLNDEEYKDMSFEEVLTEYDGKVIYLDFWGAGCIPCFKEMPYTTKLSEVFSEDDFVALFISLDYTYSSWERTLRLLQQDGMHYRLNIKSSSETTMDYNLKFIPHYVLIDKAGNVVSTENIKPGDSETAEKIRKLLH